MGLRQIIAKNKEKEEGEEEGGGGEGRGGRGERGGEEERRRGKGEGGEGEVIRDRYLGQQCTHHSGCSHSKLECWSSKFQPHSQFQLPAKESLWALASR